MEITAASHQWASRPMDQRFLSLTELRDFMVKQRTLSREHVVASGALTAAPIGSDSKALMILGPNGKPVLPTHFSFGQLSGLIQAPASYLRSLPAAMAADCLNYGLKHFRESQDLGVLLTRDPEAQAIELRAATGPRYGRIWNADLVNALCERFGDGRTGDFRVPGEFGQDVEITKKNTTLYGSDRDMFVFLADEHHRIEMNNRRDGKNGTLARGFIVGNSEVGASTLWVAQFLFDYVCMNRIIWGVQEYREVRVRHTASAKLHFERRVLPALNDYANSSTGGIEEAIAAAQRQKLNDLEKFLNARFTRRQSEGIMAAHEKEEGRPIETLWDATTAVTAYAKTIEFQDERVKLERAGGKILQLASDELKDTDEVLDVEFTNINEQF